MVRTNLKKSVVSKRKGVSVLMSSVCAVAFAGLAHAQDGGPEALEDDVIIVQGERAFVGTKSETPITEIPQSISVISAEEFRDRAAIDFQDIFRYSAGVGASNSIDSRGDFVTARGFDSQQYVDGLKRMPDFIYGARLEAYSLQSAEVLRGPSSVLYGANGPGGVLNGVSKKPQYEFGGELGVVAGTDQRIQVQGDITGPLVGDFAGRLVGLWRDGETQWGTPDDRKFLNPSVTWSPSEDTEITFIALYQKDANGSLGYLPLSKSLLAPNEDEKVDFNFYQGEPGFNGMDTEFWSTSLLINQQLTDNLSFNSRTRYSNMNTDYREIYSDTADGGFVAAVSLFADPEETFLRREFYVNREQSEVVNTDNNILYSFNVGAIENSVLVGVDYTWFDQVKNEGFSCSGYPFPPCWEGGSPPPINIYDPVYGADFTFGATNFLEYGSTQLGVYVQNQMTIADRLHILLGGRRDKATSTRNGVEELDQTAWTFRGGFIADLAFGVSPYFSYSESFLPVPGGDFFGNPFVPRTARQYEAGIKWQPVNGALITASLFDIEESNYISADPTNIQNFVQGGSVGSKGFELEASLRMPGAFDLLAAYSYTDAEVLASSQYLTAGDRLVGVPQDLASAWLSKDIDLNGSWELRAGAGVRYIGDVIDTTQSLLTPSATLVDALVSFSYDDWVVSVNASNLFNKKYFALCELASPPDGYCIAAKDRTVMGSITRKF
ncbi:TonB-dependent siderophore receptor [Hyphococcus formosus]|uniref:TonB-dependent siderophore receptor n=1 Tax=Hyphococcus formosus TaxID=3143534 RepID=UPI00398B56D5